MKQLFTFLFAIVAILSYAQPLNISQIGRYTNGTEGACEITDYDKASQKLFITNAASNSIEIIDVSDFTNPTKVDSILLNSFGGGVNSVVCLKNGYIAVAVEANVKQDSGRVVFFATDGTFANQVKVGHLPDMITYSPKTKKILVACEGEPNDDYTVDPEGSICIISVSGTVASVSQSDVTFLGFDNAPSTIAGALKKPGTTWSKDLEPEYIAVNEEETEALVVCQENNVVIKVNLQNNSITSYKGLGFKDHNVAGNGLDASDKDDTINIKNWNVLGVYQPDAIASYTVGGNVYWLSANEGDARDYDGYSSETRIKNLTLDPTVFPDASTLQDNESLGRLKTFTADMIGDTDNDGDVDQLYSYGARSFSIWNNDATLAWDSGDDIEQYIAANHDDWFNCNNGESNDKDKRSDDKGAEPEAITVGKVYDKTYAFVGLERQGGIMVYDISTPTAPVFETYLHTFNASGEMTDIAPEGLKFIAKEDNPTDDHILVVSNEVSGTTTIYSIEEKNSNIAISEKSTIELSLFPNPASKELFVSTEKMVRFQIFNTLGKEVKSGSLNNNTIQINDLEKGFYLISFEEEKTLNKKTVSFIKK